MPVDTDDVTYLGLEATWGSLHNYRDGYAPSREIKAHAWECRGYVFHSSPPRPGSKGGFTVTFRRQVDDRALPWKSTWTSTVQFSDEKARIRDLVRVMAQTLALAT